MSQQCALAAAKTNHTPGCLSRSAACWSREAVIPLRSAPLKLHPEHRLQFWALKNKRDAHKLERVQRRAATEGIRGLQHVTFEVGGVHDLCLEKTRRERSLLEFSTA